LKLATPTPTCTLRVVDADSCTCLYMEGSRWGLLHPVAPFICRNVVIQGWSSNSRVKLQWQLSNDRDITIRLQWSHICTGLIAVERMKLKFSQDAKLNDFGLSVALTTCLASPHSLSCLSTLLRCVYRIVDGEDLNN
jgi:hypothetical protein